MTVGNYYYDKNMQQSTYFAYPVVSGLYGQVVNIPYRPTDVKSDKLWTVTILRWRKYAKMKRHNRTDHINPNFKKSLLVILERGPSQRIFDKDTWQQRRFFTQVCYDGKWWISSQNLFEYAIFLHVWTHTLISFISLICFSFI